MSLCASCQSYIEVLIKSSLGTNPGIYPAPSIPGEPGELGEPCNVLSIKTRKNDKSVKKYNDINREKNQ